METPALPTQAQPAPRIRGRATRERLLDAAETLLTRNGLEAATVPAIARRAGVSVGNVYKRFPDKDALMGAVYQRFFARTLEQNLAALKPRRWADTPTEQMLCAIVTGIVAGYRDHRALLRALLLYAETHPAPDFRQGAELLRRETLARLESRLGAGAPRSGIPNPSVRSASRSG